MPRWCARTEARWGRTTGMATNLSVTTKALLAAARLRYEVLLSHKIAFAALTEITVPSADDWRRAFLAHADVYALGAAAPDTDFKDFKNHVLYPRDGFWGGAPDKAVIWYRNFVAALKRREMETATYCAGVLSHYVADVCDPFNTQWSDAGGGLHASVQRSLREQFENYRADARSATPLPAIALSTDADFLARALSAAAEAANGRYEKAIAHYALTRGAVDARWGFDPIGEKVAAMIIDHTVRLTSAILSRAIDDAAVGAPDTVSAARTLVSTLATAPLGTLARWQLKGRERRDIHAMLDETLSTGKVDATLPEHDRAVRDHYRTEIAAKRPVVAITNVFPFEPSTESLKRVERLRKSATAVEPAQREVVELNRARVAVAPPRPAPQRTERPAIRHRPDVARQISAEVAEEIAAEKSVSVASLETATVASNVSTNIVALPTRPAPQEEAAPFTATVEDAAPVAAPIAAALTEHAVEPTALQEDAAAANDTDTAPTEPNRIYLSADNDIVDAPSIGPKSAEFMRAVGIDTVEDFIRAHPIALAARLERPEFDAATLEAIQDQCRLVMTVPGLRGTHAQLFVGAGYRTLDAIASADVEKLCADIISFAISKAGQRILRQGAAPSLERVRLWAEAARAVKAA